MTGSHVRGETANVRNQDAEAADGLGVPALGGLPHAERRAPVGPSGRFRVGASVQLPARGVACPGRPAGPESAAAMPSWRAHQHAPGCEAAEVEAVVKIERRVDGGWRSTCSVCTSQWVYYWRPDLTDERGSAIRREGNCLYQYELAQALAPA